MDVSDFQKRIASILATLVGTATLTFLAGVYVAEFRVPPYYALRDGYWALRAHGRRIWSGDDWLDSDHWYRVDPSSAESGVQHRDPGAEGLTFYTSAHEQGARLIDPSGELVHRWKRSFRDVWPNPGHVRAPVPATHIYWRDAHLYPNGDVLALFTGANDTPWGYGLAKLNADSEVVWTYDQRTHHEVSVGDDGRIYTLVHRSRDLADDPLAHFDADFTLLEDFVVILDADGDELHRLSLLEAAADSNMIEWMSLAFEEQRWDILHANAVEPLDEEFTEHHDGLRPGDLLVSFRGPDALAVFSREGDLRWTGRGTWISQHDPDALPNGRVMMFDNLGGPRGEAGRSRLIELAFDERGTSIVWSYEGSPANPFWSGTRAQQQPLSNGHVLVTSAANGRLFEINRGGKLVWDFSNPVTRRRDDDTYRPIVAAGQRIARPTVEFELNEN